MSATRVAAFTTMLAVLATWAAVGPAQAQDAWVVDVTELGFDEDLFRRNFGESYTPLDPPDDLYIQIDFTDAPLLDVIRWVAAISGETFLIGGAVTSAHRITIIAPRPVPVTDVADVFLASLAMNGLSLEAGSGFWRIVDSE